MIYLKDSNKTVESAEEVAKVFQDIFSLEDSIEQEKEHFYVMHLDIRNQVKMVELVSIGGVNQRGRASPGNLPVGSDGRLCGDHHRA